MGAVESDDTLIELRRVEEDLRNARNLLETKDAVLEPGLAYTMADFVKSGGDACEIPGMLRRGFVGYPQMTSVLHQWLKIAGITDGDDVAWKALKKEIIKRLDPSALDDAASAESA